MKREFRPLSTEEMRYNAPSIFAVHPKSDVSEKYKFVPTTEAIRLLESEGWLPHEAKESRANVQENKGFTKHIVRFFHPDLILDGESIETVLINSHNRSSAYQIMMGVYRLVCSNGLIVGNDLQKMSVRHMGDTANEIMEASYEVIESAPLIAENVEVMKEIKLQPTEQRILAEAALLIENEPDTLKEMNVNPNQLLTSRRYEDREDQSLWTTFNKVQENYMDGNFRFWAKDKYDRNRPRKARRINNIDRNVKVNKALWHLAESMKNIKMN